MTMLELLKKELEYFIGEHLETDGEINFRRKHHKTNEVVHVKLETIKHNMYTYDLNIYINDTIHKDSISNYTLKLGTLKEMSIELSNKTHELLYNLDGINIDIRNYTAVKIKN